MAFFAKLKDKLQGVREKWSGGISKLFSAKTFDAEFWDSLEEQLIAGDTGLDFAEEMIDFLKAEAKSKNIKTPAELKNIFTSKIVGELNSVEGMGKSFDLAKTPLILLMIGVNGSGKTTSAGKLASMYKSQGKSYQGGGGYVPCSSC